MLVQSTDTEDIGETTSNTANTLESPAQNELVTQGETEAVSIEETADSQSADEPDMNNLSRMSSEQTIVLSQDEWETLLDALDMDSDASSEEVRDRLMDTVSVLQELPTV